MNITTPPDWRKGQTVFNFLEWLRTDKGYKADGRQADGFHIQNKEYEALFKEFINLHK